MSSIRDQAIALGAIFEATLQVDKLARSGQSAEGPTRCLANSILITSPDDVAVVRTRFVVACKRWRPCWNAIPLHCSAIHCAM